MNASRQLRGKKRLKMAVQQHDARVWKTTRLQHASTCLVLCEELARVEWAPVVAREDSWGAAAISATSRRTLATARMPLAAS